MSKSFTYYSSKTAFLSAVIVASAQFVCAINPVHQQKGVFVPENIMACSGANVVESTVNEGSEPVYFNDFNTPETINGMTIIDSNGDGVSWTVHYLDESARVVFSDDGADDWLITTGISLKAGYAYRLSVLTKSANGPESFEIKYGAEVNVESMTHTIIPLTEIQTSYNFKEFEGYILPDADGIYYVGIHVCTPSDSFFFAIDDLKVEYGMAVDVPAVVDDLSLSLDGMDRYKVTVSFTAPDKNFAGDPLGELTKIEILRDGLLVGTVNPSAGEKVAFVDCPEIPGEVSYTVQAFNSTAAGPATEPQSIKVGYGEPKATDAVSLSETATPGVVTLSWNAVTADMEGNPYPSGYVTYAVAKYDEYSGQWYIYDGMQGIEETSVEFKACEPEESLLVQFGVVTVTREGSVGMSSRLEPVGAPVNNFAESFADCTVHNSWGIDYVTSDSEWTVFDDSEFTEISSFDGDNGYAGCLGRGIGGTASLFTSKIAVGGGDEPCVSLYAFNITEAGEDENEMNIYARRLGETEWTLLQRTVLKNTDSEQGWARIMVPLSQYKNDVIQLRFEGKTVTYMYTMIDNIRVGSIADCDLAALSISAPETVRPDNDFTISVCVANLGKKDIKNALVTLYADGRQAETSVVANLKGGKKTTVDFKQILNPSVSSAVRYHAVVSCEGDLVQENDRTAEYGVSPALSPLPAVGNLKIDGNVLSWTAPNLADGVASRYTEDFEYAEAWDYKYGDWIFVDRDGKAVGGFDENINLPGIYPGSTKSSFFIFEYDASLGFNDMFAVPSGSKCLASLYAYDNQDVDDWAISPELSGNAQTISFFARSYADNYPEKIEIYYSDGSTDTSDFIKISTVETVPQKGMLVEVQLPAGAKRFAVRSCAVGAYMLMLDCFTFEAGFNDTNLSLLGYDVYRDGMKLNLEPVAENSFTDSEGAVGTYSVVAVYDRGISAPVHVTSGASGIAGVSPSSVSISGYDGAIHICGAEGLGTIIVAASGRTVYTGIGRNEMTIQVSPGIYVVRVGEKAAKIIVR